MPKKETLYPTTADALEAAALALSKIAVFAESQGSPDLLAKHLRVAHLRFIRDPYNKPEDRWDAYLQTVAGATETGDLELVYKTSAAFILDNHKPTDIS